MIPNDDKRVLSAIQGGGNRPRRSCSARWTQLLAALEVAGCEPDPQKRAHIARWGVPDVLENARHGHDRPRRSDPRREWAAYWESAARQVMAVKPRWLGELAGHRSPRRCASER